MKTSFNGLFIIALVLCFQTAAFAFRCGDRIVSAGDSKAEVMMKCGEPAARDSRTEEIIEKSDIDRKRRTTVFIDEWTYNFGPNALIRILTFTNDVLTDIKETDYGATGQKSAGARCYEQPPSMGDTKGEVQIKCGEPFWKDSREEEVLDTLDGSKKRKVIVVVDEWTYNFGPDRFIRIYQFKNGRLVDIRTGGYGK